MLNRVRERIHPQELVKAREAAEAAPVTAVRRRSPLPLGAPARAHAALAELHTADEPSPAEQVAALRDHAMQKVVAILNMGRLQTDWSERIAADWKHHSAKIDAYADGHEREAERTCDAYTHAATMLVAPLLSELTELVSVQLPELRRALTVHAEAELALYNAEMAVAL